MIRDKRETFAAQTRKPMAERILQSVGTSLTPEGRKLDFRSCSAILQLITLGKPLPQQASPGREVPCLDAAHTPTQPQPHLSTSYLCQDNGSCTWLGCCLYLYEHISVYSAFQLVDETFCLNQISWLMEHCICTLRGSPFLKELYNNKKHLTLKPR